MSQLNLALLTTPDNAVRKQAEAEGARDRAEGEIRSLQASVRDQQDALKSLRDAGEEETARAAASAARIEREANERREAHRPHLRIRIVQRRTLSQGRAQPREEMP